MDVIDVTADADVFTCNVFLVTGEQRVLVDAGAMEGIVERVAEHVDDLDAVVLTHQHGDHVDQLDAILDRFDPDCYAYDDHPRRTHPIEDGDLVMIGDDRFEAVYTPGHAADHLSFVGDRAVFSGDVVVYNDEAFDDGSFGRTDMPGQSRERLIESIHELLERLPAGVESMYPGHGDSFHGDVREVVERALERAERREPKYPEERA
ncbi:MBL fold metallo-hydrolase [Natronorarus salvus]|uniref:MBL fold metallo-hydrolase n=1 Tax=Natronorarus salvus TaxID=3117733 RepID=UPI002F261735